MKALASKERVFTVFCGYFALIIIEHLTVALLKILTITDKARNEIAEESYDKVFGARPIKRYIQNNIETDLAKKIVGEEIKDKDKVVIDYDGKNYVFTVMK